MDVLTDVLESFRLRSTLYCRSELRVPWALRFEPTRAATFHVVDYGHCWLHVDGQTPVPLTQGDVIVLPHGNGHVIGDTPSTPPDATINMEEYVPSEWEIRCFTGGGASTTLLCGLFDVDHHTTQPLIELLPSLVHIKGDQGHTVPWLDTTLKFLASESRARRPGAATIIRRLADVLFIQVIRIWVENEANETKGWLRALHDPQIGIALSLIHRNPQYPWTVATLASEVAMSRSAFAARFGMLVGEPPLLYLRRWRMHLAAQLLKNSSVGMLEVAQSVGYESEVAFSKTFKQQLGISPGAYRRQNRPNVIVSATSR